MKETPLVAEFIPPDPISAVILLAFFALIGRSLFSGSRRETATN